MDTKKITSSFNIFQQTNKELDEFFNTKIHLAGKKTEGAIKYLSKENTAYTFNQYEMLQLIDMYWNSQFTTGDKDPQGRTKLFMNVGKFRSEVASKQVDIDVKDFLFTPEDYASTIGAWLMQEEFKNYSKETYFGELINECVDNFPKYGSVVLKEVGGKLEFTPLQTLRNDQSAKDLNSARYVIEEHNDMTMGEIQEMEKNKWEIGDFSLPFGETTTVYERMGSVPLWYYNDVNKISNEGVDTNKVVDALFIFTIKNTPRSSKRTDKGHIFYSKIIKNRRYREAHWSKQYGRWLGIGEMENQIPNQVAKNVLINILKNGFEWSAKRAFQTSDEKVVNNLAKEVQDGAVLLVDANAEIKQIDLAARYGNEAQQMINEWEKNSDQKSFTYEVATGEALPSGTPFRLGVVLSNAVNSHFSKKREMLGIFFKKCVMDFLIPDFQAKAISGDSLIIMNSDLPGYEAIRAAAEDYTIGQVIKASIFSGKLIDMEMINQLVNPISIANQLFIKRPADFYTKIKSKFDLCITGEENNIEKKITSLTTLYQVLSAQGDIEKATKVLSRIMALTGENMSLFGGTTPLVPNMPQQGGGKVSMPQVEQKSSLSIPATTQDAGSK
ncbi:hypothetical protein [Methanoculleus sp.]|jgi:hypothetical protein|uniref:hypothetical protein n=1 Tax=Methanoculleus sp. TaxID=90427 RepID=UPI0025D9E072|nr:hypothetical protein [Methanoculleus sp.]MCK9319381.1 hypothetical protein [Methanoculleus sp.]